MVFASGRLWSGIFLTRRLACANSSTLPQRSPLFASAEEGGGGAEGIRTPYLYNANVALYQLSYSPTEAAE